MVAMPDGGRLERRARSQWTERKMPSLRSEAINRPLLAGGALAVVLAGCGGSGGTPPPPPPPSPVPSAVVFISMPPASLAVQASATLSAAATYPPNTAGSAAVTWAVTCGSMGACGSFGPSDNGGAVTYTAPAAIPAGG